MAWLEQVRCVPLEVAPTTVVDKLDLCERKRGAEEGPTVGELGIPKDKIAIIKKKGEEKNDFGKE